MMDTNPTREDLTWAGGVCDNGLHVRVRKAKDDRVHAVYVDIACGEDVGKHLTEILGGGYFFESRSLWAIPGGMQVAVLEALLPYLRVKQVRDKVRRVLMYRTTTTPGRKISDAVTEFRKDILEDW